MKVIIQNRAVVFCPQGRRAQDGANCTITHAPNYVVLLFLTKRKYWTEPGVRSRGALPGNQSAVLLWTRTERPISAAPLTVSGLLSGERLAVLVAVAGQHGDLVQRLRRQAVQHGAGHVSRDALLSRLVGDQRLPSDQVGADVAGRRRPRGGEAGVGDVAGHQVLRRSHIWKQAAEVSVKLKNET